MSLQRRNLSSEFKAARNGVRNRFVTRRGLATILMKGRKKQAVSPRRGSWLIYSPIGLNQPTIQARQIRNPEPALPRSRNVERALDRGRVGTNRSGR